MFIFTVDVDVYLNMYSIYKIYVHTYIYIYIYGQSLGWAVVGLMDRELDLKPEVTQGCGFESRLRQEVHDCSPGAAQSAAHCSKMQRTHFTPHYTLYNCVCDK